MENKIKYGTTVIDHNIREKLNITIAEYVFLDAVYHTPLQCDGEHIDFLPIYSHTAMMQAEIARVYFALSKSPLLKKVNDKLVTGEGWNNCFNKINITAEVIKLLNDITGSSYRPTSKNAIKYISARVKEGFTIPDFEMVIRSRFNEWGSDDQMKQYLRPETIFGSKFESYLQFAKANQPKSPVNSRMQGMQM